MQAPVSVPIQEYEAPDGPPRPRRWTREEYYRAAELGLFRPDERLELIRGEIVEKMPQNPPHVKAIAKTSKILEAIFASGCYIVSQAPLQILAIAILNRT